MFSIAVTAATKLPEFDAIVIGSGVGGGLMAARLSQAGFRVLVLEKGKYIHQRDLTLLEADGLKEMYEQVCHLLFHNVDKYSFI